MTNEVVLVRVFGIVISVVATFGFALIGNVDIALSVAIGLLLVVITLLVDLVLSSESVRRDVLEGLSMTPNTVNEAEVVQSIKSINRSMSTVLTKGDHPKLFAEEAKESLVNTSTYIAGLAEGRLMVDEPRRMELLIAILNRARSGDVVRATSYVGLDEWWLKPLGRQYLDANMRACKRGVRIMRIFLVKPTEIDAIGKFARDQSAHLEVSMVFDDRVYEDYRENFFLTDELVSYTEYSREGRLVRGHISAESTVVAQYRAKFSALAGLAEPVDAFLQHVNQAP